MSGFLNQNTIKTVELPLLLEPFFEMVSNVKLYVETSLLYVMHNLELLTEEAQILYETNLLKVEAEKYENLLNKKNRFWIKLQQETFFPLEVEIMSTLLPFFHTFEAEISSLITYGILKILQWLDLLNRRVERLLPQYEEQLIDISQEKIERFKESNS